MIPSRTSLFFTDPVANLILTIDEVVLARAQMRALQQQTSVNAVVCEFLEAYARTDEPVTAMAQFVDIAERSSAGSAGAGRRWSRHDIYEERTTG